jgi:ribonuclease T1
VTRARVRSAVVTAVVALLAVATYLIQSSGSSDPSADPPPPSVGTPSASASSTSSGLPYVERASLPAEARATLRLLEAGGPFPYDEDGSTFQNREGLLPPEPRGYYAEYTVETPGEGDRGPRRIVAGDGGELYWTADHYASFARIGP